MRLVVGMPVHAYSERAHSVVMTLADSECNVTVLRAWGHRVCPCSEEKFVVKGCVCSVHAITLLQAHSVRMAMEVLPCMLHSPQLCTSAAETHMHAHIQSCRELCGLFSSLFNACDIVCGGQCKVHGNFCQIL